MYFDLSIIFEKLFLRESRTAEPVTKAASCSRDSGLRAAAGSQSQAGACRQDSLAPAASKKRADSADSTVCRIFGTTMIDRPVRRALAVAN